MALMDATNSVSNTDSCRRGSHPASRANLRPPWQPGESPNPGGRPKGGSTGDWLRALDGGTYSVDDWVRMAKDRSNGPRAAAAQILVDMTADQSNPDIRRRALGEVLDRIEGRATQRAEVTTKADHLHAHLITNATQLDAVLARRGSVPGVDLGLLTEEERGALVQLCDERRTQPA